MAQKILIIDDDPDIVLLVSYRLKAHQYQAVYAPIAREGLAKARTEKPDLILLDIMMPEMDGYEALAELKKDPETSGIPVLMFSAKSQESDVSRAMDLGASGYIIKPFDPVEMLSVIQKTLRS